MPRASAAHGDRWRPLLRPLPLATAGVVVAIVDAVLLRHAGVSIELHGSDATWINAAFMAINYAALGYLLGVALAARRRERDAAAILRHTSESAARLRSRLAEAEKLAALGELSTAVAHEVRNPLGVIRSAAQSLGETLSPGDQEGRRASSFIVAEIDRLSNVVTSLLALARPLPLECRAVGVREILDHAVLLAAEKLRSLRLRAVVRVPPDLPPLEADPDLLCQVVLGLVLNAAEASPEGSEIELAADGRDGAIEVTVADTGSGVPADLRERIFEPFFTTRSGGVGLGLAIARRIVEAHGGRIAVGPGAAGHGARFALSLPAAAPARAVA